MTINMEVKKDGMRQTQEGIWKLTLTVHPEDMPIEIMTAPMGTRYGIAMVAINDDETTTNLESNPEKSEGAKMVTRSVMLCNDPEFLKYIDNKTGFNPAVGAPYCLYDILNITSRAELKDNLDAQVKFESLEENFRHWKRDKQYEDNFSRCSTNS